MHDGAMAVIGGVVARPRHLSKRHYYLPTQPHHLTFRQNILSKPRHHLVKLRHHVLIKSTRQAHTTYKVCIEGIYGVPLYLLYSEPLRRNLNFMATMLNIRTIKLFSDNTQNMFIIVKGLPSHINRIWKTY